MHFINSSCDCFMLIKNKLAVINHDLQESYFAKLAPPALSTPTLPVG
jgi:hypothetical protein